jgi:hypothetical protein
MESEGSLICSQDLATSPYTEPDESSLRPHMLVFLEDLFSIYVYIFIVVPFLQMFPLKFCVQFYHMRTMPCPYHPLSFDNCNIRRGMKILNLLIIN